MLCQNLIIQREFLWKCATWLAFANKGFQSAAGRQASEMSTMDWWECAHSIAKFHGAQWTLEKLQQLSNFQLLCLFFMIVLLSALLKMCAIGISLFGPVPASIIKETEPRPCWSVDGSCRFSFFLCSRPVLCSSYMFGHYHPLRPTPGLMAEIDHCYGLKFSTNSQHNVVIGDLRGFFVYCLHECVTTERDYNNTWGGSRRETEVVKNGA